MKNPSRLEEEEWVSGDFELDQSLNKLWETYNCNVLRYFNKGIVQNGSHLTDKYIKTW